ncbi:MAG TPA: 2-oxo-tetronate isomerase [Stellaceae bacterium]|nr:2-oxo-tetronate isomerase [Stellaceae bacterium]
MPKLAANLHYLFQELPFLDRFQAAAETGFRGVECLFPYEAPAEVIAERLERYRLTLALFNAPPGNREAGERGLAALPGRETEFMAGMEQALSYALATGGRRIHVLSGLWPEGRDKEEGERVLIDNLRRAAALAAPHGIELLLEPINPRDIPGYFLTTPRQAAAILDRVARPDVRLQLDLYHCQIVAGDLARHIRELLGRVAHVQIAGVPERHEPDRGEVNFAYLLDLLDSLGYDGWVGCEYRPAAGTRDGLGWARRWGVG